MLLARGSLLVWNHEWVNTGCHLAVVWGQLISRPWQRLAVLTPQQMRLQMSTNSSLKVLLPWVYFSTNMKLCPRRVEQWRKFPLGGPGFFSVQCVCEGTRVVWGVGLKLNCIYFLLFLKVIHVHHSKFTEFRKVEETSSSLTTCRKPFKQFGYLQVSSLYNLALCWGRGA